MIRFVIKNKEVGMEEWLLKQSESKPQAEESSDKLVFSQEQILRYETIIKSIIFTWNSVRYFTDF